MNILFTTGHLEILIANANRKESRSYLLLLYRTSYILLNVHYMTRRASRSSYNAKPSRPRRFRCTILQVHNFVLNCPSMLRIMLICWAEVSLCWPKPARRLLRLCSWSVCSDSARFVDCTLYCSYVGWFVYNIAVELAKVDLTGSWTHADHGMMRGL